MYYVKDGSTKQLSNVYVIKDSVVKTINNIYALTSNGVVLVWTAIKDTVGGVFGSGIWNNTDMWSNDDMWSNN